MKIPVPTVVLLGLVVAALFPVPARAASGYADFIVGNPAAFQALKPPAMERTFL